MSLFLLSPVDRRAAAWKLSTTNEPVQIEAGTEERARRRANLFFARSAAPGNSPWDQRHLVIARVIEEADPAVRLILAGDTPP